ncbi:pyruvate carboxylase [bacterium]|nr:pyruvate carboxylase [bacterium]
MELFKKLLVANRGEIAIRIMRAANELGIRTVAVFSYEDRFALHRFKADEAYPIGVQGEPIKSYINIREIVQVAKAHDVDCIHPGYGFLSENPHFAKACLEAGITFIGPTVDILHKLGDKVEARKIAQQAGVPVLQGSDEPISDVDEAVALATKLGFPVILKAAHGGGGRGMRVVRRAEDLRNNIETAQRESKQAFGSDSVFIEKFIERARHIEVQLLGDKHGNLYHLYERDCSVQRRHQKVAEIAPAPNLEPAVRDAICESAVRIGREVRYENAGTVEFLLDKDTDQFFFIEVNPRIQVEHTVTEEVTGIDIVSRQILIAAGAALDSDEVRLRSQDQIKTNGFALQCRVTSEDPANGFIPDHGRILHYRSPGGMGIRLDAGNAYAGAIITPFFDSLLVKITAKGNRFPTACRRMERALAEFRVRGVKTNIPFLLNLVQHPEFIAGEFTTRSLDEKKELFDFKPRRDRATKLLKYLAEVTINGHPEVPKGGGKNARRIAAPVPDVNLAEAPPRGTKQILDEKGPKGLSQWVLDQKKLLLTDTTMRDAHQSLLATRMRSFDLLQIADAYARHHADLFSLEMWGGATFDTAMRFLYESPWQRLADLRAKIPNILFQMLFRSSNAVGYATYPDNVVRTFVKVASEAGIDVFRIFDSLNWIENMRAPMEAVLESGKVCEPAICYTGDILNPKRTKYTLKYYVDLAKEMERLGAHILAIKDMSGLCKPHAARLLVHTLKQEIGIPVHFHTHDTAGVQTSAILMAAEEKLDIADGAVSSMSGLTSQPSLNSLVESLRFTPRETGLDIDSLNRTSDYWEKVRDFYVPFETDMKTCTAEVYQSEIPGGQYTNLMQQARSLGLGDRFHEVQKVYAQVNEMFGDIVKVTPTSKVVGDMAIFMVTNNLTPEQVLDPARDLAFPQSVVGMFEGNLGQPPGGWPAELQRKILRGKTPVVDRPGANLPDADLETEAEKVGKILGRPATSEEVMSSVLYPKVFKDFAEFQAEYSDPSVLPTHLFFYGLEPNEEVAIDIEKGKMLLIKLTAISHPHDDGTRNVFFELNGQPRDVRVVDKSLAIEVRKHPKADPDHPKQIGSPMPGMISGVAVKAGEPLAKGQKILTIEAMKMETILYSDRDGIVKELLVKPGDNVQTGDLVLSLE